MDPLELFTKNADLHRRGPTSIARQLARRRNWSSGRSTGIRAATGSGTVRRGLGIGVNTWGGARPCQQGCCTLIHPDGSVEVQLGSQDLGTGTRTIIAHGGGGDARHCP